MIGYHSDQIEERIVACFKALAIGDAVGKADRNVAVP